MILPYALQPLAHCAPAFLVHGFLGFAAYAAKVFPAIFYALHLILERRIG
jgi:hypothetical protein